MITIMNAMVSAAPPGPPIPHLLSTPKSLMMGIRIETHSTGAVWLLIRVDNTRPGFAQVLTARTTQGQERHTEKERGGKREHTQRRSCGCEIKRKDKPAGGNKQSRR